MKTPRILFFTGVFLFVAVCGQSEEQAAAPTVELVEVAHSIDQWTGVAVSKSGRIFVNYPRWSRLVKVSVAEIDSLGQATPFPNAEWNAWASGQDPKEHFVCVQSVYIDDEDGLWVLDPANPMFQGVVEGGAKLIRFDLASDRVVQEIFFDETIAPVGSYLNDIRVNTKKNYAYITDSGTGAIIVLNLQTGESHRRLYDHPSTKSEGIVLEIEGTAWRTPDGSAPDIHADGIALDMKGNYLYFQALTARTLYRIKTKKLQDMSISEEKLGDEVERVGQSGASDALAFSDGWVYLTSLEHNAIRRIKRKQEAEIVVQDPRLKWPDSFSVAADGTIYVTTAQIHLGPARTEPYRIFRFKMPVKEPEQSQPIGE